MNIIFDPRSVWDVRARKKITCNRAYQYVFILVQWVMLHTLKSAVHILMKGRFEGLLVKR